jgi:dipeptidyl aminopeptidase/acylaminoacyl peptidase
MRSEFGLWRRGLAIAGLLASANVVAADAPPAEAFSRGAVIADARISPDGERLSFISSTGDSRVLFVRGLGQGNAPKAVLKDGDGFRLEVCRWKTDQRILCILSGTETFPGGAYPITRLVGVNADGTGFRELVKGARVERSGSRANIIDDLPDQPEHVLIAVSVSDQGKAYPAVMELNVNTGGMTRRHAASAPLTGYLTDAKGEVRIGCGGEDATVICKVRDAGGDWRVLSRAQVLVKGEDDLSPVAITPDGQSFYAFSNHNGRRALWKIDLADRSDAQVVFTHPRVDIGGPLLGEHGELRAVYFEDDKPALHFFDDDLADLVATVQKAFPGQTVMPVNQSKDSLRALFRVSADTNPGTFVLADRKLGKLQVVGRVLTGLPALAAQQPITYKARDGVEIPGYLTLPAGQGPFPLIVMPHGGPAARDNWGYDFLVQFLAHRGYAVVQSNFRGSDGFGQEWLDAGHQDWGGITYNDVIDATRWAQQQGHGDPARTCIVGWSFGGYMALLAATRDAELFRCSAAIAPVSDLQKLVAEFSIMGRGKVVRRQVGADGEKLRRDSPAENAANVKIPLLVVHGTSDWQVPYAQATRMVDALKRAGKPVTFITVDKGGHSLFLPSQRQRLLESLDTFLAPHLGPGAAPRPAG